MKFRKICTALAVGLGASMANAADIDVEVTNLTHGIYFTPLLVTAHDSTSHLFQVGTAASPALQAMAEGGALDDLVAAQDAAGAVSAANPAGGLLGPAQSTSASMDTGAHARLSVVAMLLPTNDGFVGLNGWQIPSEPGTYTIMLNGYDAGTEANDEIVNGGGAPGTPGIPASPGGSGETGATGVTTTEATTVIHVHRGNLGDTDPAGGVSDVDARVHRWLNPVARVIVTVN